MFHLSNRREKSSRWEELPQRRFGGRHRLWLTTSADALNRILVDGRGCGRRTVLLSRIHRCDAILCDESYLRRRRSRSCSTGDTRPRQGAIRRALADSQCPTTRAAELGQRLTELTASRVSVQTYTVTIERLSLRTGRAIVTRYVEERGEGRGPPFDSRHPEAFSNECYCSDPPSYRSRGAERWRAFVMRWPVHRPGLWPRVWSGTPAFLNYKRLDLGQR